MNRGIVSPLVPAVTAGRVSCGSLSTGKFEFAMGTSFETFGTETESLEAIRGKEWKEDTRLKSFMQWIWSRVSQETCICVNLPLIKHLNCFLDANISKSAMLGKGSLFCPEYSYVLIQGHSYNSDWDRATARAPPPL